MKKKILYVLILVLLLVPLAGCGKKGTKLENGQEAVVTFKDIVLKKSILLPPICRGIFTLNPGTAKPFLTVLFEPNLYPAYA